MATGKQIKHTRRRNAGAPAPPPSSDIAPAPPGTAPHDRTTWSPGGSDDLSFSFDIDRLIHETDDFPFDIDRCIYEKR